MILQALYKLAQDEELIDDPDFERKPVSWVVRLRKDGTLANIEDLRTNLNVGTKRKSKYVGKSEVVPFQTVRTSGDIAFFLVDKPEYVFGVDPASIRPEAKLNVRAELFRKGIECAFHETHDEALSAVLTFLISVSKKKPSAFLPQELGAGDLIAFKVGDDGYVHLRDAVKQYWKSQRKTPDDSAGTRFRCLITGEAIQSLEGYPLVKKLAGGTPSGVAIISYNASAFESYRLARNENAPLSRAAAEAAVKALNRLLDSTPLSAQGDKLPQRNIRLGSDTVVVYWSPEPKAESALDAIMRLSSTDNPELVADVYQSIFSGKQIDIPEAAPFYAMTLTGTQGRAIIRDWFESTVSVVIQNLAQHFEDLDIVRNTRPPKGKSLPPVMAFRFMMEALSPPNGDVPAALATAYFDSALRGHPYGLALLQKALLRERAEIGRNDWIDSAKKDARAAIIKAVLNRRRRFHADASRRYEEVNRDMEPNNNDSGYRLGMLMAVLERIQQAALGEINASIVDRFFGSASATPKAVFSRLLKNARHHVRKALDDPKQGGTVFWLDRLLDEIVAPFDTKNNAFPPFLNLEEQGLFILGYHHMRKWIWLSREERETWEQAHPDAPRAFMSKKKNSTDTEPAAA